MHVSVHASCMHLAARPPELFVNSGADPSEAGWSLIDTVVLIKVVTGILAAAMGALAVTAAAKDAEKPAD